MLPGAPTIYQGMLDHPDRDRYDLSTLRVAVTGAADIPVELIRRVDAELPFSVVITGYGLTEGGHGGSHVPRRRRRDHRHDRRPAPTGLRAAHRRRRRTVTSSRGSRGRSCCAAAASCPTTSTTPRRPPRPGRPTAGCAPATSGSSTPPDACASSDAPRTCSSSVGSTPTLRRSRTPCSATPTSARPRSSASPTPAWARWAWPSSSCGPAPAVAGDDIIGWSRDQMANYKVPRAVVVVDDLPRNATGKVVKDELRRRPGPGRRRAAGVTGPGPHGLSALSGLRVVELGVWVAAPSAAALLADWGAEVIKVESPTGDPMRNVFGSLGIGGDLPNPAFALDNRGKRSVVLDLREPGGARGTSRSSWPPPTSSSPTSGPTPSTSSTSRPRRRSPGTRTSSTAASAATASGARTATARPTTSAPSGPGRGCRARWRTRTGTR